MVGLGDTSGLTKAVLVPDGEADLFTSMPDEQVL